MDVKCYPFRKREIPESLMQVLQNLENDYQEMRRKVLSGVPLDHLRPMSVDCWRIATKGRYIPAEVSGSSRLRNLLLLNLPLISYHNKYGTAVKTLERNIKIFPIHPSIFLLLVL